MRRDDHAAFFALLLGQFAQQFKPQPVRQAHVSNHRIEPGGFEMFTSLLKRAGRFYVVALPKQRQLVQCAQVGLVINDQDAGG